MKKAFAIIIFYLMIIGNFCTISAMSREKDIEYQTVIKKLETISSLNTE